MINSCLRDHVKNKRPQKPTAFCTPPISLGLFRQWLRNGKALYTRLYIRTKWQNIEAQVLTHKRISTVCAQEFTRTKTRNTVNTHGCLHAENDSRPQTALGLAHSVRPDFHLWRWIYGPSHPRHRPFTTSCTFRGWETTPTSRKVARTDVASSRFLFVPVCPDRKLFEIGDIFILYAPSQIQLSPSNCGLFLPLFTSLFRIDQQKRSRGLWFKLSLSAPTRRVENADPRSADLTRFCERKRDFYWRINVCEREMKDRSVSRCYVFFFVSGLPRVRFCH